MSDCTIRGLTSIIIPCWNQLEFTRQCLAALKAHTLLAWELIVIDNGSTDGTARYLAGAHDMSSVPMTIVSNSTNVGFPAAVNQGLQLARGEFLVLLNNDVVVTDGWLDQLIALACIGGEDFTAENMLGNGRPPVDFGAGSGDPRTAPTAENMRGNGRPAVDFGAGSGDPRTAPTAENMLGNVRPAVELGAGSGDPRTRAATLRNSAATRAQAQRPAHSARHGA